MIQIKSLYGQWQTVSREKAAEFCRMLWHRGATMRGIEACHLRGISFDELISPKAAIVPEYLSNPKISCIKPTAKPPPQPPPQPFPVVEMELLARNQAFLRFQQDIRFSLTVWQNDEDVRRELPCVQEWVGECVDMLVDIVDSKNTLQ